jgi:hypothetical protein
MGMGDQNWTSTDYGARIEGRYDAGDLYIEASQANEVRLSQASQDGVVVLGFFNALDLLEAVHEVADLVDHEGVADVLMSILDA